MKTALMICDADVKESIMTDGVKAYLADNPDRVGDVITQRFMLRRMCDYYLSRGKL